MKGQLFNDEYSEGSLCELLKISFLYVGEGAKKKH
jgi:hypothetical protein